MQLRTAALHVVTELDAHKRVAVHLVERRVERVIKLALIPKLLVEQRRRRGEGAQPSVDGSQGVLRPVRAAFVRTRGPRLLVERGRHGGDPRVQRAHLRTQRLRRQLFSLRPPPKLLNHSRHLLHGGGRREGLRMEHVGEELVGVRLADNMSTEMVAPTLMPARALNDWMAITLFWRHHAAHVL